MKKVIILVILFIVSVLLYLKYDNEGYVYGLGCTFCNKDMPYGVTPKINSNYPQDLVLPDDDDFELVGSGFRYYKSSFEIKDFLGYGYNDTSVLLKCTDSLNNVKYLISYKTGYKSYKGKPGIGFKDIENSEYNRIKGNYHWIDIDKDKSTAIGTLKFLLMIGALLSLFFIIKILFKLLRS